MMRIQDLQIQIERVDDIPIIYGLLQKMDIQANIDSVLEPHGQWQGLTTGWVITIWLMHILSEHSHCMVHVQDWVKERLETLQRLTGQPVQELDFTDDRLALCLRDLQKRENWAQIEAGIGRTTIRVFQLEDKNTIRFDASNGTVYHNPAKHTLFKVGKAKNGLYETQFKLMLGSLDPFGFPLVANVVAGNRADDPLYAPCYRRVKETLNRNGLLLVGDSKMSALATRALMVGGDDYYLTPLAHLKDEPKLLDELLQGWPKREEEMERIFLAEDIPDNGDDPDPELAIAYGFEVERSRVGWANGQKEVWTERLLVVRSFSYVRTMQAGLHRRLNKAEKELQELTPQRGRGKRQIKDEESLYAAVARIEKKYRVKGLFDIDHEKEVSERNIRGYKEKPARVERQVRFQISVRRNQEAIAAAEFKAGWCIYATNAPQEQLSLAQGVLVYRDQYIEENIFRRLQGKILSITPVYIHRDDHAEGLFHLLTIAVRLLALGDYVAREALAEEKSELDGIYPGNPKRSTATPTTERMLKAFNNIELMQIVLAKERMFRVSPLSSVQQRILNLLGLPLSLYTNLQIG